MKALRGIFARDNRVSDWLARAKSRLLDASNQNAVLYDYTGHIDHITTYNNWEYTPPPWRFPVVDSSAPVGLLDTGTLFYLYFQNRDTNLGLIKSGALPAAPLPFDDYNYSRGSLALAQGDIGRVEVNFTELATVPVPSTLLLLMSGLGALALIRKQRAGEA